MRTDSYPGKVPEQPANRLSLEKTLALRGQAASEQQTLVDASRELSLELEGCVAR